MPLPLTDSVAFRGVPSLGAERKLALSLTLTQKQVEALFARQSTLRELGSSQYPLEIDFDDNKIYIGDIATPFSRFKEDGTREICQRSPTVSKPLAGISLSGVVIGKLNIHRDFDQDVADSVRKATEAEHSKRNERTIVVLNNPPPLTNGKKSRSASGASTLAKKAMSNRIVSAQAAASNQTRSSTPVTPASSSSVSRSKPPGSKVTPTSRSLSAPSKQSTPTTSATQTPPSTSSKEPDFPSLRARLIHFLALNSRTTQQVLLEIGGRSPSPETMREIEDILTAVAQEIPPPKKVPQGPVLWELQGRSWEEVQPYEWPDLTPDQRTRMARKGRLACGQMNIPPTDPLWERFETRVSESNTLPGAGKGKGKAVTGQLVSNFKGGMFPKEKKPSTKGGGVASGVVTKTKASSAKAKIKKDQEDEVEARVAKAVDGLTGKANGLGKGSMSSSIKISKKKQEDDTSDLSTKPRTSLGSAKTDPSPLPPRSRHTHEEISHKRKLVDVDTETLSEMEEGEVLIEHNAKKPKVLGTVGPSKSRIPTKGEPRDLLTTKGIKETKKVPVKDESVSGKLAKDVSASGSKTQRAEKEGGRDERERENRRSSGKRGRRPTPSFSSDEADEEIPKLPAAPTRASTSAASKPKPKPKPPHPPSSKLTSSGTKAAAVPSSRARAPSPPLPSEKEALRRRYHVCYARYMGVTSKFHEQRAKVEALLATDGDSLSADEDVEMMDAEQLMQLRGEHEQLRDELQRILREHEMVF